MSSKAVLDFEYGINTGNRFLDFVDHDEDPEEFIARQAQTEEKTKKASKDSKTATSASTKKPSTKPSTTATTAASTSAKTNKENLVGKSSNPEQRKQPSVAFSDNNSQQARGESARGGRGFARRGGSAGQDRPPYEGGGRGGGQQRTQRFNKFEGQQGTNEGSGFEQSGDAWNNESGNDNQSFGGFRGRGRGGRGRGNYDGSRGGYEGGRGGYEGGRGGYEGGRGGYEGGRGGYEGGRGGYEGGRGGSYEGGRGGRGRGRGGRGYYNRNAGEGSQQQQPQEQESSTWEQSADSNFQPARPQSSRPAGQDLEIDPSSQDVPFDQDTVQRGGRGHFRARTFRSNRQYGSDRPNYHEREGGSGGQDEYRQNRRQHDRQPRNYTSSVKPVEKKDGEGAHNWGSQTENPDETAVTDEAVESADATGAGAATTPKDWSAQVDEAEKQMTLDEYKKQKEEQKKMKQEKLPQFNRRTAGEGADPKQWAEPQLVYRKKNDDEQDDDEEAESGAEESGSGEEEAEEEHTTGKKKIISIPLQFTPIDGPRGPAGGFGSRGGPRRGGTGGRFRDRPNRDRDDQQRPYSPTQQQSFSSQQPGEYQDDERQQSSYRGGSRGGPRGGQRPGGFSRGENRRSYVNSARGSRGSYRSGVDPNAPDLDNALDFPTLPKQ